MSLRGIVTVGGDAWSWAGDREVGGMEWEEWRMEWKGLAVAESGRWAEKTSFTVLLECYRVQEYTVLE